MQNTGIWRSTFLRILAAILSLSLLLGGIDYWLEMERIDDAVVRLARKEAHQFVDAQLLGTDNPDPARLERAIRDNLSAHFPIVELYDRNRRSLMEVTEPGKEWVEQALSGRKHGFPDDGNPIYYRIDVQDVTFIQVLIPIKTGYFEGVYEVEPDTIAWIKHEVLRAVAAVILSILATGLLLLPLLMALNRKVLQNAKALLAGNIELMEVLGSAIAKRDSDTSTHNYRVTLYAIALARAAGLDKGAIRSLIAGAFLHDIGKIGIPDAILLKPGKLTDEEFSIMKTHVEQGEHILEKSSWLTNARAVVLNHHEKYDGTGYPAGLAGDGIPLAARIFAIVDVFDALTSKRPYKAAFSFDESLDIIRNDRGRHFDPVLVDHFDRIAAEIYRQLNALSDEAVQERLRQTTASYFDLD